MVSLFSGGVTLVLLTYAVLDWRRPVRTGAHSEAATKKRIDEAEADRIVRSHHVLSGRLMDAPTGRLWPSERHRVPPWVPSSRN